MFGAVAPTDFIEEIWVRDLVDATWAMSRLRRLLATFWTAEVSDDADQQAASRALAEAKLMEGAEKEEMNRLLDTKSGASWQSLVEQNPRANEKFQALYSRARSTLDMNAIQAKVMRYNMHSIKRIKNLIMITERRIDEVIRELDRHRLMRKQLNSFQDREGSKFEVVGPKMIEGKTTN